MSVHLYMHLSVTELEVKEQNWYKTVKLQNCFIGIGLLLYFNFCMLTGFRGDE